MVIGVNLVQRFMFSRARSFATNKSFSEYFPQSVTIYYASTPLLVVVRHATSHGMSRAFLDDLESTNRCKKTIQMASTMCIHDERRTRKINFLYVHFINI